jgi:glyoxylase-like metal-dependent hydrolase (beta-lactamase superfamily II)
MKPWKVFVVLYGARVTTTSAFLLGETDNKPLPMNYYVWGMTNGEETVVVDTGFNERTARERKREMMCTPMDGLAKVGIDPKTVKHVIISHLHWDHAGNWDAFPKATFYLQETELKFWTGRHGTHPVFKRSVEGEEIAGMVKMLYDGRVKLIDGVYDLMPGIRLHKVGGHTAGIQCVETKTKDGTSVLASDASHYYRNFMENLPVTVLHDVPGMLDGFALMRRLATREDMVLPGHDPDVMNRYPAFTDGVVVME